ncbi:zinc finger protein 813-like isoform X2 [Ambystoma mexicanum]|uniref:zinc finger protein 813-like isoform X2 n=1 Tax=Ambystoma mexicanum TaxID=8296 RepID=UPI0037E78B38
METRKRSSGHDSHKELATPVTFQDVAACFSEEEWKLLHEWQKELYRNVMKEIHQALISLGPLIASSVFSIKPNEKEDLDPVDHHNAQKRHSVDHSPGHVIATSVFSIRPNEKEDINLYDHTTSERGHAINHSPGFQFLDTQFCLKDEDASSVDLTDGHHGEEDDDVAYPSSGHVVIPSVVSFGIKQEEDVYSVDHQICERIQSTGSAAMPTGPVPTPVFPFGNNKEDDARFMHDVDPEKRSLRIGGMNRPRIEEDSIKYAEERTPYKASSEKAKINVHQSSHRGMNSIVQPWAENNQEFQRDNTAHFQMGFTNQARFVLHQGTPSIEIPNTYNECRSNLRNAKYLPCIPNMQRNQRPYTCTECNKSFSQKGNLSAHRRIHTGEKPYTCTDCHKSFSRRSNLNEHRLLIHTRVRPFKCTECERSFTRKSRLDKHRRLHS